MSFYREVAGYRSLKVEDFVTFLDTLFQACCGEDKYTDLKFSTKAWH